MKDHSDHYHENLCWLDLETTGLDPLCDAILELGITITTKQLEPVASKSWVFRPSRNIRLKEIDPFVWKMHQDNNLWNESLTAPIGFDLSVDQAGVFISEHKAKGSPLCGSTISFDRNFLKVQAPELLQVLHYRNIDVSTLKNMMAIHFPSAPPFEKPKGNHRVLGEGTT
jgi:oligoribonuclease